MPAQGTLLYVTQCAPYRSGMAGVVDLDALLAQRLHGAHDPAAPKTARAFDIRAIEERAIERQHAAGFQDPPDLFQHLRLVGHQMDGVEEHDCIRGFHQLREPLGATLHELGEPGGYCRARFLQRRRRRIDADNMRRRLLVAGALEDELRNGARAAPEVDDDLPARTNHSIQNPAVHMREKRMPSERGERKAVFVRRWVQGCHSL